MPCHVWTALSLTDTLALYKKSITTKLSLCNGSSSLQCFWSRRALLIPATTPVHGKTAKGGRRLKEPRIAWSRTQPFMFTLYKPYQRYCIYLLLPIWGVKRVLNLLNTFAPTYLASAIWTKYIVHIFSCMFTQYAQNPDYTIHICSNCISRWNQATFWM